MSDLNDLLPPLDYSEPLSESVPPVALPNLLVDELLLECDWTVPPQ